MLRVTSHKCQCHRGTVINFGVPGKMSSRCLFGLSFPTPLPTPAPCMSWSRRSRVASSPSSILLRPSTPRCCCHGLLFSGGKECLIIFIEGQRLPELTEIFFSDQSHFLSLPTTTTSMRCLFSVCCWCMMGEVLTQHWGAVTLHCQRGWLAYHSLHLEEIHHHSRQGFPSLGPFSAFFYMAFNHWKPLCPF